MKPIATLSTIALLMASAAQAAPTITLEEDAETLHLASLFERGSGDGLWASLRASFDDDDDDRYEDDDDRYDDEDDDDEDDDDDDRDDDRDDDDGYDD